MVLEETRNAADAANRSKATFLFNMSHDIRTPMNAILGFTDIGLKNVADTDKSQDCYEKIKDAKEGDYDVILMDIQMPIMDGYETTRAIRMLGNKLSKIPILAMTANAFEEDRKAAIEAGMNEHIAKPIKVDELKETLVKFL